MSRYCEHSNIRGDCAWCEDVARIAELTKALADACEPIKTRPHPDRSAEYTAGFRAGALCQLLQAQSSRRKALELLAYKLTDKQQELGQ